MLYIPYIPYILYILYILYVPTVLKYVHTYIHTVLRTYILPIYHDHGGDRGTANHNHSRRPGGEGGWPADRASYTYIYIYI